MEHSLPFSYKTVFSQRKTLAVEVSRNGLVTVRAPFCTSEKYINKFLAQKSDWVQNAIKNQTARPKKPGEDLSADEISALKKRARALIEPKVKYYSALMGVKPTRITITQAKTRFGSCSGKNAISFSCYLALYDEKAVDYVTVHELAHIKQHNHSAMFWNEVKKILPDYKERKKLLK